MPKDDDVRLHVELVLRAEDVRALAEMIAQVVAQRLGPPPQAPASNKPLLSISEAARRLGCSTRSLRRYISLGQVRFVKIGNRPRFTEAEISAISEKGLRPWLEDGPVRRRR